MNKKTQRTISRIILTVLLIYGILLIILPIVARASKSPVVYTPTTTTTQVNEETPVTENAVTSETVVESTTELETEPIEEVVEETESEVIIEKIPEPEPETEPEVIRYTKPFHYTEQELDLLSRLVESEGGIESYETKLKIASVVLNRVCDPKFPSTIREVIYAKSQFSVTVIYKNGIPMIDHPASEESIKAARDILDNGSVLPQEVQVFYAKSCKEPWVTSRVTYGIYDNTVFAYIYGG